MKNSSSMKETGAPYEYTKMTPKYMMSLQEWIKTLIIIIVTTQPMKTVPITNKIEQPTKMVPVPTRPTKTEPATPLQWLPKILQKITNKRRYITML